MAERLRVEDGEFLDDNDLRVRHWLTSVEGMEAAELEQAADEEGLEVTRRVGWVAVQAEVEQQEALAADTYGQYLREAGRTPLLTKAEEVNLARRIENGRLAAERAEVLRGRRLGDQTLLAAAEEELSLLDWTIQDAAAARQHLISANLRLVISIAKKYRGRGLDALDLVQEGNIGLMRAVDKFDYKLGYKFSTYATWWIRQAVQRAIATKSRLIRLPDNQLNDIKRLDKLELQLQGELNRQPTDAELGDKMGFSIEQIEELRRIKREPVSLETPIGDGDSVLGELLEDTNAANTVEYAMTKLFHQQIRDALEDSGLGGQAQRVLRLRFGLEDGECHTLERVASRLGLSPGRVRIIEYKSLLILRKSPAMQRVRGGLPS